MNDRESTEELLDRLIEEHLTRLTDREQVDFAGAQLALPSEAARRRFRVEVTAEEYLLRRERGEVVSLPRLLERLADEGEREDVRRYLEDSRRAGRFLPRGLAEGEVLSGKFRIVRELGRGGTAIVYEAEDVTLERRVAVKVFNPESGTSSAEDWEEVILRESRILATLSSRNIVTVIAAEREGGHSYVAMDYVEGRDLHEVLVALRAAPGASGGRRAGLSARLRTIVGEEPGGDFEAITDEGSWYRTVARIGQRAATAVEKAHEAGVLHRDLKPKNLILVPGGEPVLLDFGLASARGRDREIEEEGFFGTVEYLAPEQARDLRTGRDPRTDVYQLGLILYELLTLRPAFPLREAEPLAEVLARKRGGELVPPRELDPRIPVALEAICRHALATRVEERYRSAGELSADLSRFERGLPPRFAPMPMVARAASWATFLLRQPAAAVVLLAAVVVAAVLLLSEREWVPPRLTPFAMAKGGGPVQPLHPEDTLRYEEGCSLGVSVEAFSQTVIYAFAIYGGATPESRFLVPVTPRPGDPDLPHSCEARGLVLEASDKPQFIVCRVVPLGEHSYEGILVFACERSREPMDDWQAQLSRKMNADRGLDSFNYVAALELGKKVCSEGSRGPGIETLTAEEHRLWFGTDTNWTPTRDEWREYGLRRDEFIFAVAETPRTSEENPR